jgi:hypothetical protein
VAAKRLVRLTSELEEEHIVLLQWYTATPAERKLLDAKQNEPSAMVETSPGGSGVAPYAGA